MRKKQVDITVDKKNAKSTERIVANADHWSHANILFQLFLLAIGRLNLTDSNCDW